MLLLAVPMCTGHSLASTNWQSLSLNREDISCGDSVTVAVTGEMTRGHSEDDVDETRVGKRSQLVGRGHNSYIQRSTLEI